MNRPSTLVRFDQEIREAEEWFFQGCTPEVIDHYKASWPGWPARIRREWKTRMATGQQFTHPVPKAKASQCWCGQSADIFIVSGAVTTGFCQAHDPAIVDNRGVVAV